MPGMATRLINVSFDSSRPERLARFWSSLLGWATRQYGPVWEATAPADSGAPDLNFIPVAESKAGKNRVHLDLASRDEAAQETLIAHALEQGARRVDIGQGRVPWEVLADPEGNVFCVLEPRTEYAEMGALAAVVVDSPDPQGIASFWQAASGLEPITTYPGVAGLGGSGPRLEFVPVSEPKHGKLRVHLDVAPESTSTTAVEVARLGALGAVPADVGQGEESWEVLADPEGNEFCVLTPR